MGDGIVYVTEFQKKKIVVKNNVKNRMIQNFTCFLNEAIKDSDSSVLHAYGVHSQLTIPQYDKSGIDPYKRVNDCDMPCLMVNCEWVEYQDIIGTSKELWRLPAITPDGKCILCKMESDRVLDISKIRQSAADRIVLLK